MPPGQDPSNKARKSRVSLIHEIKMDVLLEIYYAVKQVLATWAFGVVPSGLSLRAQDMSLDISLLPFSDKTAHSDTSESIAVGLSDPLGCNGVTGSVNTAVYVTPP
jgi:hypothetical protein